MSKIKLTFITPKMHFIIFNRYSSVVSEETSAQDSTPLLELKKDGLLKVCTLGHAINVLKIAGDRKLIQLRTCLEGKVCVEKNLTRFR